MQNREREREKGCHHLAMITVYNTIFLEKMLLFTDDLCYNTVSRLYYYIWLLYIVYKSLLSEFIVTQERV